MLGTVTNAERDVIGQCSQSWLGKALPDLLHRAKFCHWIHGMEEKTNFMKQKKIQGYRYAIRVNKFLNKEVIESYKLPVFPCLNHLTTFAELFCETKISSS